MVQRIATVSGIGGASIATPSRTVDDFHVEVDVGRQVIADSQPHPLLHEEIVAFVARVGTRFGAAPRR